MLDDVCMVRTAILASLWYCGTVTSLVVCFDNYYVLYHQTQTTQHLGVPEQGRMSARTYKAVQNFSIARCKISAVYEDENEDQARRDAKIAVQYAMCTHQ